MSSKKFDSIFQEEKTQNPNAFTDKNISSTKKSQEKTMETFKGEAIEKTVLFYWNRFKHLLPEVYHAEYFQKYNDKLTPLLIYNKKSGRITLDHSNKVVFTVEDKRIDMTPMTDWRDEIIALQSRIIEDIEALDPGSTIIEIGSGQGNTLTNIETTHKDKNLSLIGIDLLSQPPDTENCTFIKGDIESTNLFKELSQKADIIFSQYAFQYLTNPFMALNNVNYLLKQGGKAHIHLGYASQFKEGVLEKFKQLNPTIEWVEYEQNYPIFNEKGEKIGKKTDQVITAIFTKQEKYFEIPTMSSYLPIYTGKNSYAHEDKRYLHYLYD